MAAGSSAISSRISRSASLIRVRSKGRWVAAAGTRDEFPRLDDACRGSRRDFRGASGVRDHNALYWRAITVGIESGCHTFDSGDRRRIGHLRIQAAMGPTPVQRTGALSTFAAASAPRERKAFRPSAACGVTCRLEWPARLGPACDGGFQIEFDCGHAIWNREWRRASRRGCAAMRTATSARSTIPGRIRLNHRVPRDQGAGYAGARHASARCRHRPRRYRAALRATPSDWRVHGIDLEDDRVERCRTAARNLALSNATFSRDNLLNLSAVGQYDLITNTGRARAYRGRRRCDVESCAGAGAGRYLLLTFPSVPQRVIEAGSWASVESDSSPKTSVTCGRAILPTVINGLAREVGLEPVKTVWTYGPFAICARFVFCARRQQAESFGVAALLAFLLALSFLENHTPTRTAPDCSQIVRKPAKR